MILKDFLPGRVIKLHEGDDPGGLLGLALTDAAPKTNAGKMSCRVVISTSTPDRSHDVVVCKGMDLSHHKSNPVVLLNHNKDYPVGFAEDPVGNYTVRLDGPDRLVAETYFSKSTRLGEQAFRLVEDRVLRGASIGFLPVPGMVEKFHAGGAMYKAGRLVEYSHLVLPDNPEALVIAVEKGYSGKPLCPELLGVLKPLCPERAPVVTGGWEKPMSVEKAMPPKAPHQPVDPMAPVDGDPNAQDPNAQDPAAGGGHKEAVDGAVADLLGSIYLQYTHGSVDMGRALELFQHCLETHGKVSDLHGEGGMAGPGDDLGDLDGDGGGLDDLDLDGDDAGDDGDDDFAPADDDDSDTDGPPKRKKKALADPVYEYTPAGEQLLTDSHRLFGAIEARAGVCDPAKLARNAGLLRKRMEELPLVRKVLAAAVVTKAAEPPPDPFAGIDPAAVLAACQTVAELRGELRAVTG